MSDNLFKRTKGETREDGYRFYGYNRRRGRTEETWLSPESYAANVAKKALWRARNRDKACAEAAAWRADNRDRARESCRRWAKENPDKMKAWREANRDKTRAQSSRFRKRHPDKVAAKDAAQRFRRKAQTPVLSPEDRALVIEIYKLRRRLSTCTGLAFHVDHIFPVAKGGLHIPSNLRVISALENLRKKDSIL
jgi:hypothetical protein